MGTPITPLPMTEQYLSLKEASLHTGKSRSSLRRFVEKITKAHDHPDRSQIKPNVDEVAKLHAESHPFSWRVSMALLEREFAKQGTASQEQNQSHQQTTANQELLSQTIMMLKTELDEKNKQIAEFQERQRETNVLLQQTTEKLMLLTDGKKQKEKTDNAVTVYSSNEAQQGIRPLDKKVEPEKRETFWDRMRKPLFQK